MEIGHKCVLQSLGGSDARIGIKGEHLLQEFNGVRVLPGEILLEGHRLLVGQRANVVLRLHHKGVGTSSEKNNKLKETNVLAVDLGQDILAGGTKQVANK